MGSKGYKDNNTNDMRGAFEEVMFSEGLKDEEETSAEVRERASCRERRGGRKRHSRHRVLFGDSWEEVRAAG